MELFGNPWLSHLFGGLVFVVFMNKYWKKMEIDIYNVLISKHEE